jgi:hypothetical protein
MGIFTSWKDRQRNAFVDRAEDLAGSLQMEIYKYAKVSLATRHDEKLAGEIAAGIANYVCRFGYVNPAHQSDMELLSLCESERSVVLRALGDTFKANATGTLILLGAAWQVDLEQFKAHISLLAREGFARTGRETPNVSRDLPKADLVYMYEVASMGTSSF